MSSTNARSPFASGPDHGTPASRFATAGPGAPYVRENLRERAGAGPARERGPVHLTLAALSEDHTRLLLVDGNGSEFTLDLDNALRSALRGELPRPAHLEIRMESALRPRDIQARIRAGESAESVAAVAGTSLDKIMVYAGPVLAEREHVADRAQRSSIRRRPHEVGVSTARTVDEAVQTQLRAHRTDPTSVEWDSFRREDGRWTVTGRYDTPARTGVATFTYDVQGNYVLLEDDDARWLVGDALLDAPVAAPQGLRSVPVSLGDDAIRLVKGQSEVDTSADGESEVAAEVEAAAPVDEAPVADTEPVEEAADPHAPLVEERTIDLSETVANIRGAMRQHVPPYAPAKPQRATMPSVEAPSAVAPAAPVEETPAVVDEAPAVEVTDAPAETDTDKPVVKKSPKRRGRASVPSWDEIMFGGPND
ncbi:septation protein SepH [Nocardioides yefusunii]|uniref:Septation protein SepH n=1 Tax=Nocardioides yefusunii TaxID=2500546 RepID=A0ABW1QUL4_9ACTN|nr:septation protein SepH [Nocardioides yefusunii]